MPNNTHSSIHSSILRYHHQFPEKVLLGALYNELQAATAGTVYPPGRRVQLSLASFCIVREHHHAIALLLDQELYASAFALMRPLYEGSVKGMWFAHCAQDGQLEGFAKDKELPAVGDLADDLLKSPLPADVSFQLRRIKTLYWKAMSSFSHAGHAQLKRWLIATGVEPTYSTEEIREVANFTAYVVVVSALERARLGGNDVAVSRITMLLPEGKPLTDLRG